MIKQKKLIYECKTHQLLTEHWDLLTEAQRRDIKLFEREIGPLFVKLQEALAAELTEPEIQALFKKAEQVAVGNRTMFGKGLDVAKLPVQYMKEINKKMDDLFKDKIKTMQPVKNFDAAFDKLKDQMVQKTGGAKGIGMEIVESYRKLSREHPIIQSLVIAAFTVMASIIAGPFGGAIMAFGLKAFDRLMKGEAISDVIYKGLKSAAIGALVGLGVRKLTELIGNMSFDVGKPIPLTGTKQLVAANININVSDPQILAALKQAGINPEDIEGFRFYTSDIAGASKIYEKINAINNFISKSGMDSAEEIQRVAADFAELRSAANAMDEAMHEIFLKNNDFLLDPSKNAILQQSGYTTKVNFDDYQDIVKQYSQKMGLGLHTGKGGIGGVAEEVLKKAGLTEYTSNAIQSDFIPTEAFAKEMANVAKQVDISRFAMQTEISLQTISQGASATEMLTQMARMTSTDTAEVANMIVNARKAAAFVESLSTAVSSLAQGAVAGADTAKTNQQDAANAGQQPQPKPTTESLRLKDILAEAGFMDNVGAGLQRAGTAVKGAAATAGSAIKGAAANAMSGAKTGWTNATQQITYDKLLKAWQKAGKPTKLQAILDLMKNAGMNDQQLDQVQGNTPTVSRDRTETIQKIAAYIKKKNMSDSVKAYVNSNAGDKSKPAAAPEPAAQPAAPAPAAAPESPPKTS